MLFPYFKLVFGYVVKGFIMIAHRGMPLMMMMMMLPHMWKLCSKNLAWVNLTNELFIFFFVFQILFDLLSYSAVDGVMTLFQAVGVHLKRLEVNDTWLQPSLHQIHLLFGLSWSLIIFFLSLEQTFIQDFNCFFSIFLHLKRLSPFK